MRSSFPGRALRGCPDASPAATGHDLTGQPWTTVVLAGRRLAGTAGVAVLLALAGCAASGPQFSGQSLASDQLRRDTLEMLRPYHSARTGCERIEAIETSVVKEPGNVLTDDSGAVMKGSPARERWIATACGTQAAYQVDFIPDGAGGNFISIKADGQ